MRPIQPELINAIKVLSLGVIQTLVKAIVIQKAARAIKALKLFIQKGVILRANSVKIVLEYAKQSVAPKA